MRTSLRTTVWLSVATALLAAWAAAGAAEKVELPRYRFQVGQELVYDSSTSFQYKGGQLDYHARWDFWVLRDNPDGSWRLLVRFGKAISQSTRGHEKLPVPDKFTFGYFDLFPDGRIIDNDSLGFQLKPSHVLALLPRDEKQARAGWVARERRMGETTRYRLLPGPGDGGRCKIEAVHETPMDEIYGSSHRDEITFDLKRGLPERIDLENRQTYGFSGEGRGTTKLEEVKSQEADWCRQLAADADRYFAAKESYRKATEGPTKAPAQLKAALAEAVARLEAVRGGLKLSVLKKAVEEDLAAHKQSAKYHLEDAERRAELVGRPAADWSTTDLEGKAHALKDYRGKVVVMDFWYRGCGWCVRAMPQMKEVAAHFQGRPVVVFGMNTDRKLEDAKFVVEKMGLNYPNLKAEGLPQRYKVQGFPTLIIIDREGVVRDVHVGYSPTLKEDVIRSVETLLK